MHQSIWMHCREKAVPSWAYCGGERKALPMHIIVPFSPDRCGFMFSVHCTVQFLLIKEWRGPFYHGNDVNVYPGQQRKWISHAHVLSPEQWVVATSSASGLKSLDRLCKKRPKDYHQNPVYIPSLKIPGLLPPFLHTVIRNWMVRMVKIHPWAVIVSK